MVPLKDVLGIVEAKLIDRKTSDTATTYAFMEPSEMGIAFVQPSKTKRHRISKGLSWVFNRRRIRENQYTALPIVTDGSIQLCRVALTKERKPILIIQIKDSDDLLAKLWVLLQRLNMTLTNAIRIGVDDYTTLTSKLELSATEMLKLVRDNNQKTDYIFHVHRGRKLDYLKIQRFQVEQAGKNANTDTVHVIPGQEELNELRNDMAELLHLLRKSDDEAAEKYAELLINLTTRTKKSVEIIQELAADTYYNIFDNKKMCFLLPKRTLSKYQRGYCLEGGGKYVPLLQSGKYDTNERYVLVSQRTRVMLDECQRKNLEKISIIDTKLPPIKWIVGVPGSGKTATLMKKFNPETDIILTQTLRNLWDIRQQIGKDRNIPSEKARSICRTVASYIVNWKPGKKYAKVIVDEAAMMHPGYLGFISEMTQAKEMLLFGDAEQIPFIPREITIPTRGRSATQYGEIHMDLSITKRCPVDVCYVLRQVYPHIRTTNTQLRSLRHTTVENIEQIEEMRATKSTLLLTFTQEEKAAIASSSWGQNYETLTIHEAQGLTRDEVILIRLDNRPLEVYNSVNHVTVALTRHTSTFTYISVTQKLDEVKRAINRLKGIDSNILRQWMEVRLPTESPKPESKTIQENFRQRQSAPRDIGAQIKIDVPTLLRRHQEGTLDDILPKEYKRKKNSTCKDLERIIHRMHVAEKRVKFLRQQNRRSGRTSKT